MAAPAVPAEISAALEAKRCAPEAVLDHIEPGADLIVGLANGEPVTILDALEAGASDLDGVSVHQMFPLRERPYMHGEHEGLHHVSWFLSPVLREPFHKGTCSLVPNHFSEVPDLMRSSTKRSLVLAAVSSPDRHGYFSLGTHAEYVAALIGEAPFFVEANAQMPRTFGENQVHVSEVVGRCEADYPLVELPDHPVDDRDRRIAELVAERIPDGATLQAGIGSIPNEVLGLLRDHKELGVHTELFADGFIDLVEAGALTGTRKQTHRNKIVTTSALGKGAAIRLRRRQPGGRVLAGQLHERPPHHRPRGQHARDQRVARGRLPRPVCVGVAGERVLVIAERARKLIEIAHPRFRDELERTGRELGYL